MNRKWLVAIAAGIAAGVMVFWQLRQAELRADGGEKISLLVLNEKVSRGTVLQESHLGIRQVPIAWVDERAIRNKSRHEAVGMTLALSLDADQVLQWSDFEPRIGGNHIDLADEIQPGQRAVTIPVTSALAMGGLLRPGHRVDILVTTSDGAGGRGSKNTRTLLQNITVLAVGSDTNGQSVEGRFHTITLSVTADQGELLANAAVQGVLAASLRGYGDAKIASSDAATGGDHVKMQRMLDSVSPERHIEKLTVKK